MKQLARTCNTEYLFPQHVSFLRSPLEILKGQVAHGQALFLLNLHHQGQVTERAFRTARDPSTSCLLVPQENHAFYFPLLQYGFLASFLIFSNCWWKLLQTTVLSLSDVLTETEIDVSSAII